MKYDLALFQALNEEYRERPLVPAPRKLDPSSVVQMGDRRAQGLSKKYPMKGKRLLEIGCGRGETCRALVTSYGCTAVGTDIKRYPAWDDHTAGLTLLKTDLSAEIPPQMGTFNFAYSLAVFEHVLHPYAMLKSVYSLLQPGGQFHLVANLYRGPQASHRYREVFFPWPHLLFTDDVFEQFYESIGRPRARAAWVNQLSIGDYYRYFDIVGFQRKSVSFRITPLDEGFYKRFAEKLARIPRFDLERDFIITTLQKPADAQ